MLLFFVLGRNQDAYGFHRALERGGQCRVSKSNISGVDLKITVSTWYNNYISVNFISKQKCEFHSGHSDNFKSIPTGLVYSWHLV